MKRSKRLLAFFLCIVLFLPLLPATVLAAEDEAFTLDNGFIQVSVSKRNGGFLVMTNEGSLLKKSDNNKKLLYHSGAYDTSFVSVRIGSGADARDYLFGGKYDNAGAISVTQKTEGGDIVAAWSVEGITFTQTISLAAENASEHGMVSVSLEARNNSGKAVPIQARILLDTCLGDQDWAHYQVSGGNLTNTLDTEQIITDEAAIRSFYAVDDIADPSLTAYVISNPARAAIGHWNNLASSLFDFGADSSLNFTNAINDYLTADSACAMYYDLGTVGNGQTGSVVSYYGVYSNHSVDLENRVAINTVAPLRLNLNEDRTAYARESKVGSADFAVTVSAENFKSDTSGDLENVLLAVRSTGNLRSLSDSGAAMNGIDYTSTEPMTISYSRIGEGETITKTLYFQAKPLVSASYERITIGMYKDSVTSENLLGEKIVYVLLPGSDGNIPKVSFMSMTPDTIYSSGTRHLYVAVTNDLILTNALSAGICLVKAYSADGTTFRDIDPDSITVTDGVADIALTDDVSLAVGSWYLQLEWTDDAVAQGIVTRDFQKQTASILHFKVSDDPKYKNDCYGVLAAVKYGKGTPDDPYYYRLEAFQDEQAYTVFAADEKQNTEILLVFRGEFTADKRFLKKNEDGKTVGAFYYTAVSKKTTDPATRTTTVDNLITINNCLDFEGGTMSIYYEEYDRGQTWAEASPILVEFDGDLYTSDARTSVWKGKAGITKLEQGEDYALLHYDENGKRKATQSTPITLIWPNVYGLAQTLAGMAFKLAYGQFGVMEKSGQEIGRTIAFTASLSLKFMSSGDEDDEGTANYFGRMKELWKDWRGASIYQYAYHGARFEQLTNISMNDKDKSGGNDKGVQASVMVQDILFGCGEGFVGLNFTVEIGVKNMIDSLPKITGKLSVNTINNWSFGLAGSCKMSNKLNLEAKLSFKSYKNIPVPDDIYFFIGGFNPGINLDGCGVVWITGLGGGISNIYDTIFCRSGVPPLKLIVAASFSIVQVLDGNAKIELSLTGINLTASDLKIFGEIEAIKKVQLGLQWYPDIKIQAGIYVSMFEQVIEGQGYIILLGKNYTDWFFEMFIQAALKIPASVPLVGGMTLIGAELGVSTKKIWGAFEALKLGIGVTYYWGEKSVHFGSARDKAQPTYPNLLLGGYDGENGDFPVAYDPETDRTLYARFGTNFEAPRAAQILSENDLILMDAAGVWSAGDRTSHKFNLGDYDPSANAAAAVQLTYSAESREEAMALAEGFRVTDGRDGTGAEFPLTFYDGSNADSANANVTWDSESKLSTFGFSVTALDQFNKDWFISTGTTPADVVLYNVLPLPEVTGVNAAGPLTAGGAAEITWGGSGLDELDSVSFFLVSSTDPSVDAGYPMGSVTEGIDGMKATLEIPGGVPAGSYYIRAVYAKDDQLNGVVHSSGTVDLTNPSTPAAVGAAEVRPAGDLRFRVSIPETGDPNTQGYLITVYNADGSETDITGLPYDRAASGDTVLSVGGSYTAPVRSSADDHDSQVTGTQTTGLTGGQSYRIGITPYQTLDTDGDGEADTVVYGGEYLTDPVVLPAAEMPAVVLSGEGKTLTAVRDMGEDAEVPVFTVSTLALAAEFSEAVTGTWTLDDNSLWGGAEDEAVISGSFSDTGSAELALSNLTDGSHTLRIAGEAADGDSFSFDYPFIVDTTAPRLLLSAPLNGSVFGEDGSLLLSGVTDKNALLTVAVDGRTIVDGQTVEEAGGTLSIDGVFALTLEIPDHNSAAVHTVVISAVDENGNSLEDREIIVVHPGLGRIAELVLTVDGSLPADGNLPTPADGSAQLALEGVTSDGIRFALDADRVRWNSFAAEGEAEVDETGLLTWAAATRGFVEAGYEVTSGAWLTACLSLGSEPESGYVSVSSTAGGTARGGGYYTFGDTVTLTAEPEEGYLFDGWELTGVTVEDASALTISFRMPAESVTAKAVFREEKQPEKEYTVTFDPDGGSSVAAQTVESGKTAEKPADPTKAGYRFEGWFRSGVLFDFSTPITRDITLKAKWTKEGTPDPDPQPWPEPIPVPADTDTESGPLAYADLPAGADPNRVAAYTLDENGNRKIIPISAVMDGKLVYLVPEDGQEVYIMENPVDFGDIRGHWAENSVIWAAAHGLFNGVGDDRFEPNGTMTRAMFVTVLYRIAGAPEVTGECPFRDVEPGSWYEKAVTWAAAGGIVNGVGDDRFDPNTDVTREQMCCFVARFLRALGYAPELGEKMEFADADTIAAWAAEDVEYCQRAGIVGGRPGGIFDPKAGATRAENAVVMQRVIEAIINSLK